jgi:hypothetical protein
VSPTVWFKVDDAFWSHPKVIELSPEAGFLWVRAGSYAAQHLTDGVITLGALRMLGAARESADELVLAGLWSQVDNRTWVFHDWAGYQPTREQVEADRAKEREKKRVQRERGASRAERGQDGRYVSPGDMFGDSRGVSSATRPDPTRTPSIEGEGAVAPLSPFCEKHQPNGPKAGVKCRACGTARMAYTAHQARAPRPFTVIPGARCPDGRHKLLADGTCTLCDYRRAS